MDYVSRKDWGARRPKGRPSGMSGVRGIGVHQVDSDASGADSVKDLQSKDMNSRNDIRFNWLVDSEGTIYEGRGWRVRPTVSVGNLGNKRYHAVAYLGDKLTEAGKAGLKAVIDESKRRFGNEVRLHGVDDELTEWVNDGLEVNEDTTTEEGSGPVEKVTEFFEVKDKVTNDDDEPEQEVRTMEKLNNPMDVDLYGDADVEEGETLPDLEEIDPNELYSVEDPHDKDPEEGEDGFEEHVAEVDQDLGDVPEGDENDIEFFGDDDDFDEDALPAEEGEDK